MRKTLVDQTYNVQLSETMRRLSRLEALLSGAPIANAKIDTIIWDKAQGGIATLGGLDNVNGVLRILDGSAVEKVTLNKDGIIVRGGKLILQNEDDETSIDAKGIVSTVNFTRSDAANGGLNQVITSTSYVDVTGMTLTFVTTRPITVVFLADMGVFLTESVGNTTHANFWIFLDDGAGFFGQQSMYLGSGNVSLMPISCHVVKEIPAGTHTVKVMGQLFNKIGSPNVTIFNFKLSYVLLGT